MPIYLRDWKGVCEQCFHASIFTCGYERRARFLASQHTSAGTIFVLDYESKGSFSYNDNREFYKKANGIFLSLAKDEFIADLLALLEETGSNRDEGEKLAILFDVSSCSRRVIAQVMIGISERFGETADLTCVYALASFSGAPESELPSYISEPVVGTLAGWSDDLSKPPCAVIGLGYEPGRALGCIDYLEIPEARLLLPRGPDARFEQSVLAANRVLISEAGASNLFSYNPLDPIDTYEKLDSLVFGLSTRYRPVLIPLGPKIFAALSIALAIHLSPRLCVWRTSAGQRDEVSDRDVSGDIAAFSVQLPTMRDSIDGTSDNISLQASSRSMGHTPQSLSTIIRAVGPNQASG
ncbi:MAG: hypothetical protein KF815_12795 [Rhodospirillales bacterium]|nr:hypothetical protein [Rhodospirillales bacterium]